MKSNAFARRVNAAPPGPVVAPLGAGRATGHATDPPPCPACGSETLLFFDPQTARAEPVCLDCGPLVAGAPATSGPTTAELLVRHARAYADEHFPSWAEIILRIRLGEPSGAGERGELLLVLTKPPDAVGPSQNVQTKPGGAA